MSGGPLLITGASGFLGRHLLRTIADQAPTARVVALVRDRAAWDAEPWTAQFPDVHCLTGTLHDSEHWSADPALAGCGAIVHLAAIVRHSRADIPALYETNVRGTLEMVRLAARLKCRLVFVSTSGTVGCSKDPTARPNEDAPYVERTVATWPYYHSKVQAEREARALATELGVELVIVRPPVMLGPGDHRGRSSTHVTRVLEERLPFTVVGGMHFVDVRDVAAAVWHATRVATPRPVYHLVGAESTLAEFFARVARLASVRAPRIALPGPLALALARVLRPLHVLPDPVLVEMATHYWGLSSRFAEPELQFRSRPPDDTLRDTIAALRSSR